MTDKVKPALSTEEWKAGPRFVPLSCESLVIHNDGDGLEFVTFEGKDGPLVDKHKIEAWDPDGVAGVIAVANDCLPASDPRKITRETVAMLRRKARAFADSVYERESGEQWHDDAAPLRALADALESYLPPKET